MEVAAALLDASRKLSSEKDNFKEGNSTGNMSMGSGSSWASTNEQTGAVASFNTTSWLSNPWSGERKRTMSDCVSKSEKISTMAWLGGWPLTASNNNPADPNSLGSGGGQNVTRRPSDLVDKRTRRASCKGIESAMAGGLGKVWYDS